MKAKSVLYAAALVTLTAIGAARGDDLRASMEADNARWLAAFNTNAPAVLSAMYVENAVVLPSWGQPINGRPAIGQFWKDLLKAGDRKDHTFEITSLQQDGRYAYQVARFTLNILDKSGAPTKVSGNTVRIFERQSDGAWLTRVHIFNRHQ